MTMMRPLSRHYRAALIRHQAGSNGKHKAGHSGGITPGFQAPAPRRCQWLEGEARERDFCGAPARLGSSYCDEHHVRCWIAPATRKRAEQRKAQKPGRFSFGVPA